MPLWLVSILGLEVGSFANVCIHRWPRNMSIRVPSRSHCPWCGALIRWVDNIPVVSFLILRGRCRSCRSPISPRYPLVELSMAVMWTASSFLIRQRIGSPNLIFEAVSFLFIFMIIVTTFTDFDWKIIPDEASYSLIFGAIVLSPGNLLLGATIPSRLYHVILGILTGALLPWLIGVFGGKIFKREVMGGGDVKLLAGLGGVLGWPGAIMTLFGGSILGSLASVIGLLIGSLRRRQYIPFGPFLNAAAIISFLALFYEPNALFRWYMF